MEMEMCRYVICFPLFTISGFLYEVFFWGRAGFLGGMDRGTLRQGGLCRLLVVLYRRLALGSGAPACFRPRVGFVLRGGARKRSRHRDKILYDRIMGVGIDSSSSQRLK